MAFILREWLRTIVLTCYVLLVIILVPILVVELSTQKAKAHLIAWVSSGVFSLCTLPVSLWNIVNHLRYYTKPSLQRYYIRIIAMVPIYSVNAWLAIRYPKAAIYLDTIRECYEAFVIYSFMAYLIEYLYSTYPDLDLHLEEKPPQPHLFPLCRCKKWPMGSAMILRCKHGVLQYTVVRPIMTALALVSEALGIYDEGNFTASNAWTYVVMLNNISQIVALYCLVLFYKATSEELRPVKPVWKFGCVKAVVFLAFWQGVAIAILVKLHVIISQQSVEEVSKGIQDFLICIEMFLLSWCFLYAFGHRPFIPGPEDPDTPAFLSSVLSMWDMSDVRQDIGDHIKTVGSGVKKIKLPIPGVTSQHFPVDSDDESNEIQPLITHKSTSSTVIHGALPQFMELTDLRVNGPSNSNHSLNSDSISYQQPSVDSNLPDMLDVAAAPSRSNASQRQLSSRNNYSDIESTAQTFDNNVTTNHRPT